MKKRRGQTLNLDQILVLIISKLNKWDSQIQIVAGFEKNTKLHYHFSVGTQAFNNGAKTARVNVVKVLGETACSLCIGKPHYTSNINGSRFVLHHASRDTLEGTKGGIKQKSKDVENKRVSVMTEEYRDLGFHINKGAEDPYRIAPSLSCRCCANKIRSSLPEHWIQMKTSPYCFTAL